MIEADILTYLAAQTEVSDIVGAKLYPFRIPQTAVRPLVLFEMKSKEQHYQQHSESDLVVAKIAIVSQDTTYKGAKTLAAAVKSVLSAFAGTMGASFVHFVEITDESDDMDQDPSGAETAYFKVTQDFTVSFV